MYVATPAMRGWSETNDAQRQTAFDLMQSKIDDCDHVDESNHPSGLNSRAMHKLKEVVDSNGQSWSTVKQNYILNEYCTDSRKNVRFRLYAAAQSADVLVNATTDALHRNGMWDNTLVILSSDNGGWPGYENFNWPFRGGKSTYFEGGIRMHTALGGGFLRPQLRGLVSNAVTSNIDWWPTLSWMAGLDPYYDPKEDHPDYGRADAGNGLKWAPNAPDGLNMVHSWNKVRRFHRVPQSCHNRATHATQRQNKPQSHILSRQRHR